MKTKTLIIMTVCFLSVHFVHAQTELTCYLQYSYDAGGNRTLREYVCSASDPYRYSKDGRGDSTTTANRVDSFQIVSIIPNPTQGPITITCNENLTNATLIITDMNGKIAEQTTINGYSIQMDMSKLSPGAYNVSVVSNGTPTTRTLIKMSVH